MFCRSTYIYSVCMLLCDLYPLLVGAATRCRRLGRRWLRCHWLRCRWLRRCWLRCRWLRRHGLWCRQLMKGEAGWHVEHHLSAHVAGQHEGCEERWQWLWACKVLLDSAVITCQVFVAGPMSGELVDLHRMVSKAKWASRGAVRCECTEETLV